LNRYTQLKEPPLEKDQGFELHPDVATEEAQGAGFNNYLDEFRASRLASFPRF
jgi:lysophospholipid hydrolase